MSLALADVKHPGGDRSENSERPITAFNGPRPTLTPRHYTTAAGVTIGAVLYLLSLAFVGAATVGAFFGVSLMTGDFGAYDRTLPPAETELPRPISEATLPNPTLRKIH
jgi:hypothetical protein